MGPCAEAVWFLAFLGLYGAGRETGVSRGTVGSSPWAAAWVHETRNVSTPRVGRVEPAPTPTPPRRRTRVTAQNECFLRSLGEFPGAAGDVTDDIPGAELGGERASRGQGGAEGEGERKSQADSMLNAEHGP